MVGQRQRSIVTSKPTTANNTTSSARHNSARSWTAGGYDHKDIASTAQAEQRRKELKREILAGVKDFNVEQYRKSDEELKAIKNKHVRAYYEAQNQKLDDWAEVDSLVWSLADDVIDSTNPDADRDGIVDSTTPLKVTGDDVEAFLPAGERERRARSAQTAQRALNASSIHSIQHASD